MFKTLSPEEIERYLPVDDGYSYYKDFGNTISLKAHQNALKQVVEWLKRKNLVELMDSFDKKFERLELAPGNWQALLKEVSDDR